MPVLTSNHVNLYVLVELVEGGQDSDNVLGVYLVRVADRLPRPQQARAALDTFHTKISISLLENYSIYVCDETGQVVEDEQGNTGTADFEKYGDFYGVGDAPWKNEAQPLAAPMTYEQAKHIIWHMVSHTPEQVMEACLLILDNKASSRVETRHAAPLLGRFMREHPTAFDRLAARWPSAKPTPAPSPQVPEPDPKIS